MSDVNIWLVITNLLYLGMFILFHLRFNNLIEMYDVLFKTNAHLHTDFISLHARLSALEEEDV